MLWVPLAGPPRLVLPAELWGRLDEAQRDAVLAHELAHLKRRDHWVRRLEAIACGLYWWDPVAWWARREIGRAEELCCDAWVLRALPAAALAYAEALVATAVYLGGTRRPLTPGASGVGRLGPLKRRLHMILSDAMPVSVGRKAPQALLVVGLLSLPFLPGWASGEPPGAAARIALAQPPARDRPAGKAAASPGGGREPKGGDVSKKTQAAPPDAGLVNVIRPLTLEIGDSIDVRETGQFATLRKSELKARVSGRLESVECRLGQVVKKGDVLFVIDPRPYRVALDKAEAEVRRVQARVKARMVELKGAEIRERAGFGKAGVVRNQLEEAEAAVEVAQADRDLARLNLDSTRVEAPIDGVVSRVMEQPGNSVRADDTLLAVIISLDPLCVDFFIDESTALRLKRLNGESGVSVLIGVRDEEGFPHRGRVEFVDPEVQPVAETAVRCRAVVPNPDGSLRAGLKARTRLLLGARHKALLAPEFVLSEDHGRHFLFVVNDQDVVEHRYVKVGLWNDGWREVEQGLKADERVAWGGHNLVGKKVVPVPITPSGPSTSAQGKWPTN
jgi:RND family efflux transporter MFP subunit